MTLAKKSLPKFYLAIHFCLTQLLASLLARIIGIVGLPKVAIRRFCELCVL